MRTAVSYIFHCRFLWAPDGADEESSGSHSDAAPGALNTFESPDEQGFYVGPKSHSGKRDIACVECSSTLGVGIEFTAVGAYIVHNVAG